MRSAADYLQMILMLMPPGKAGEHQRADLNKRKFWQAIGDYFARIDSRLDDLMLETDPRTTSELLSDWERNYGLPTDCAIASDLQLTDDQRRSALVSQVVARGGATAQYLVDIAGASGYDIDIKEYATDDLFSVDSSVDDSLLDDQMRFVFDVIFDAGIGTQAFTELDVDSFVSDGLSSDVLPRHFDADSSVDDALSDYYREPVLECLINRVKPAHTTARFIYN